MKFHKLSGPGNEFESISVRINRVRTTEVLLYVLFKVILYSYLILKKTNERITDS